MPQQVCGICLSQVGGPTYNLGYTRILNTQSHWPGVLHNTLTLCCYTHGLTPEGEGYHISASLRKIPALERFLIYIPLNVALSIGCDGNR